VQFGLNFETNRLEEFRLFFLGIRSVATSGRSTIVQTGD
jgi:hypothetical protein